MHAVAWALTFLVLAATVRAADGPKESLAVLPPKSGQGMLHAYLLAECGKCFDARRKAVAAIKTPEQFLERQKKLRAD